MSGFLAILIVGTAIGVGLFLGWQINRLRSGDDPDSRAVGTFLLVMMVTCGGLMSFLTDSDDGGYSSQRRASIPTQTVTEWHDLILNGTVRFSFETTTRVMMRHQAEKGQVVNMRVTASDESQPMLGIIMRADDGEPRVFQNFASPDPNIICELTYLENGRHTFFFEAKADITYTVNFESGSACSDE